ncbi:hypothetical protein PMAYCL1PPCAC_00101 [Pristionchus mayeri]|uniref:Uncharacterized protein n=1 Tax=Pristionchus mayeri TaxID=1317129 RepID=A0AAN4YZV9_9BILA|nr:hypothetical protein PMAYCL1PPCAC_00101 [Pristionchus mayeri]
MITNVEITATHYESESFEALRVEISVRSDDVDSYLLGVVGSIAIPPFPLHAKCRLQIYSREAKCTISRYTMRTHVSRARPACSNHTLHSPKDTNASTCLANPLSARTYTTEKETDAKTATTAATMLITTEGE